MIGDPLLTNLGVGLAALLLVAAAMANGLTLFHIGGRWTWVTTGATAGAVVFLAVAMAAIATSRGPWWQSLPATQFLDPQQVVLGLVLATLVVQLVLAWRLPVSAASLLVDLLALVLVLFAGFMIEGSGLLPGCYERDVPIQLQWVLFLVGAGGLMVASGAGLTLALRAGLARRTPGLQWPRWIDLHALLKRATELAMVSLGAGIVVGLWWSWRLLGSSAVGGPGDGWAILALLVATMSYLVRRTGGRWGHWVGGLILAATAVSLLGLLAGFDLL